MSERVIELPWVQLPGPPAGPVTDIAVSAADPDYLYATTRTGGLYASSDGGGSWRQGPGAEHHRWRIVASPHDPREARTKVNRTLDAGRVWFTEWHRPARLRVPDIENRLTINDLEYDPFDQDVLYAGVESGLFHTVDEGATWDRITLDEQLPNDDVRWIEAASQRDGVVYAVGGLSPATVRSEDHGESWDLVPGSADIPDSQVRGLAVSPDGATAYVAVDSHGIFGIGDEPPEPIGPDFPSPYFLFYDGLTLSADGERLYFIAYSLENDFWGDMQLYVYDTSADTVRPVDMPEKPASVTAHPTRPETVYFGGWSWVWESQDGGKSWTALSNEFVDRYLAAVGVNPDHPGTVFPGSECSSGIWTSHDDGRTFAWKRSGLDPYHSGEFGEHYIQNVAAGGDRAYATTAAGLLVSEDNGNSWRLLDNEFSGRGSHGEPSTPLAGVAIDPDDPETVYVGPAFHGQGPLGDAVFEQTVVWKSRDGGQTWSELADGFPTDERTVVQDILVSQHDSEVVYVATMAGNKVDPDGRSTPDAVGRGIYKSTSGGEEWAQLPTPFSNVYSMTEDAGAAGRLYASSRDEVYRSIDGGRNWELVLPLPTRGLQAHPAEGDVVFAGAQKHAAYWDLLVSEDGGGTWAEGNLTIQVGREPDSRPADGIELHGDYRGACCIKGEIIDLAVDASASELFAATRGAGLWRSNLSTLTM